MFSKDLSINLRQEEMLRDHRSPPTGREGPPPYILYVWGDQEKNSSRALHLTSNLQGNLAVVDVRNLPDNEVEPWLTGVPTLLHVPEKTIFRGTKCLDLMVEIGQNSKRRSRQPDEDAFLERTKVEFPPILPQPQMKNQDEDADTTQLPHFREPENESEDDKAKLKAQVEAIMARRESVVGSKKGKDEELK